MRHSQVEIPRRPIALRGIFAAVCFSLAALPNPSSGADKDGSSKTKGPRRQREYQIVLHGKIFKIRAAGVTEFSDHLQELEGKLGKEKFNFDKKSGDDEKRMAVFLDTAAGDLKRARYALRYRLTLEEWKGKKTAVWKDLNYEDSHAELTIKHNAKTEAAALDAPLNPVAGYLRGDENEGKWQSKLELDLYQPGTEKYGHSVSLYGKHFRTCVKRLDDLSNMKAVGELFPGLLKIPKLTRKTRLVRRYEYRWTRDGIELKFDNKKCSGTLMLVYSSKNKMNDGTSAPDKVEFSWRLKEGKNWTEESLKYSEIVREELWKKPWATLPDAPSR